MTCMEPQVLGMANLQAFLLSTNIGYESSISYSSDICQVIRPPHPSFMLTIPFKSLVNNRLSIVLEFNSLHKHERRSIQRRIAVPDFVQSDQHRASISPEKGAPCRFINSIFLPLFEDSDIGSIVRQQMPDVDCPFLAVATDSAYCLGHAGVPFRLFWEHEWREKDHMVDGLQVPV